MPWWLKLAVALAPAGSDREPLLAWSARSAAGVMARKFIAGATPDQATRTVLGLRDRSLAFTADLLGEAVISEAEADLYQQTCLDLIRGLAGPLSKAPEVPLIDRDQHGPIPRVNLSLKLSSLTTHFDPIHAEATLASVAGRLRPILRTARELGAYVHVDMEQYSSRALTYAIFRRILAEPEFRDWPDVGIVVQAYQPQAEAELRMLLEWVESRGTPITIRLVKGAYWDYEVLTARRLGWPEPVFLQKWQSDAMYERCTRFLIEHHERLRPAFGSHNIRSLAHAIAAAETAEIDPAGFELQTLHGMGDVIQAALVARGHRVRVYTPYGAMLPGMAYLVRRLLENTSNESFLKASLAEHVQVERPAAQSRGGWSHGEPDKADDSPVSASGRGTAPVPQRAGDRLCHRRESPGDDQGHRGGPPEAGANLSALDRRPGDTKRSSSARFVRPQPQLAHREPHGGCHRRACSESRRRGTCGPPGLGGHTRPRPRRGTGQGGRQSCGSAASSWPPGRSSSAASPGARPTPTSPRPSISASSTPGR